MAIKVEGHVIERKSRIVDHRPLNHVGFAGIEIPIKEVGGISKAAQGFSGDSRVSAVPIRVRSAQQRPIKLQECIILTLTESFPRSPGEGHSEVREAGSITES